VLSSVGPGHGDVWQVQNASLAPVAVEYRPVAQVELSGLKTVPVNATAQEAIKDIVKAVGPKGPTMYTVVLPKGAELARAVGHDGFRGFARGAKGIRAQAVLKPVGVGAAAAVSWPAVLVAGSVMALDMAAQAEQRANQRRVLEILGRQVEDRYRDRLTELRTADSQLTRALANMLDGRESHLEVALKSADDVFHRAQLFLEQNHDVLAAVRSDGKADWRDLEERLEGGSEHFFRELQLARLATSIRRKALVADAAHAALAAPANPYAALRNHLEAQVQQLEEVEAGLDELTEQFQELELTGPRYHLKRLIAVRQARIRELSAPPASLIGSAEVNILVTASGEMLQVLPADEGLDELPIGNDLLDADRGLERSSPGDE
jgi:hypothetical protein